ncbi:hypothetical protein [Desulfocurvus sp. DL9XJH121]
MGNDSRGPFRGITGQGGFFCVLFIWACLLFNWPLITLSEGRGLFLQLFLSAVAVILALLVTALSRGASGRKDG